MSGLFGANTQSATQAPNYVGLQTQTSVSTLPVPWLRGRNMLAPNIIWYGNFTKKAVDNGSPGKGGGGGGSTSYDYSAGVILALCEGPIKGIGTIWKGQSTYTAAQLGLTVFDGSTPQAPWGWLESTTPAQALGYPGTAYLASSNYDLGAGATLDNHNVETMGPLDGTGANGIDADPALVIQDFLSSPQDGIGFPASSIDTTSLLGASGDSSYQTYCRAMGLAISPCLTSTESGQSILARWLQLTNTAAVWSAGKLKFIPYGDEQVAGNGVTWNPATQIQVDLDETDFVVDEGEPAVKIMRSDPSDAYNIERLEITDRANAYTSTPIEARDQNAIQKYGVRTDDGVTASEICDPAVAAISAQLILQRGLYIRKTYQWRLSWEYGRLEAMDCVTLTVAAQHLNRVAVRITNVKGDDAGILTFTAEELPPGVASAALYPKQGTNPYSVNRNIQAAPVNLPVIFEPSADLAQTSAQIWIGASGGFDGVADPNWGGAKVHVSADGTEYGMIGKIKAAASQGYLAAILPAPTGDNPDQVSALLVDLTESAGTIPSAAPADAQAGRTLCWVDGEIIAYGSAELTAPSKYTLTYLERGLYGTTATEHAAGTPFVRLNTAIFKYDLPKQYVGQTLHFKFVSFNIFEAGFGDFSTAVAYTLTPTGEGFYVAPPTELHASQAVVSSTLGMRVDVTLSWTASATSWVDDYEVAYRMGDGAWTTFTTAGQAAAVITNVLAATYTIRVTARGLGLESAAAEIVWDVTTDSIELAAVTGLELAGQASNTSFVGKDAHFDWRMNAAYGSSEALTSSSSAGSNYLDSWFQNYRVTIFDLEGNALRTETVTDPSYVYTFEKNAADGGPHRSFRIEVVWTDKLNHVSAPASLVVKNPAPSFPTKILPLSAFKTVSVQFAPPTDTDYAGTLVFMATESFGGSVPDPSTLVYDGTDTLVNIPAVAGTEYFLVLASYDSFGKAELNYTSEYTTTTALVGSTDIALAAITTQHLDQDLNQAIDLVTAGPTTPGSLQAALAEILTLGGAYTSINSTVSTLTTTVNGNTAAITNEASTRAAADKANASAITALSAQVASTYATITQLNSAVATAQQAATQQVNTLSASLPGTYATFTTVNNAIAGINAASSSFLQQLNSTVGGHTTSIQQQAQTINGLSAQYTVKIDNNGHVSGFGLASSPINGAPFSSFVVNVDDFAVAAPGATAFSLQVVNGVVTIPNAAIQNAAITNAKIANLAVDNSNIAVGAATVAGSVNIGQTAGTGGYVNVATCTITLKSAATVVIAASWGCNYDSGFGNTNQQFFGQIYGGAAPIGPVLHTGVATTQTPSYMWSTSLAAGTYQAVFWWQGDNSHVQILAGSMTVLAMQK